MGLITYYSSSLRRLANPSPPNALSIPVITNPSDDTSNEKPND